LINIYIHRNARNETVLCGILVLYYEKKAGWFVSYCMNDGGLKVIFTQPVFEYLETGYRDAL